MASVIPTRNVVLTAASLLVSDLMAALYTDIVANSTWTVTDQVPIFAGAPGSFSMTLRNPAGDLELNMLNAGLVAVPNATQVRLGINPDGSADPIVDSSDPSASAANFSGGDNGRTVGFIIGATQFILLEWEDALMILTQNAALTAFPTAGHWGKIMVNGVAALASAGNVRLDGNAILGPDCRVSQIGSWIDDGGGGAGTALRKRVGLGQGIDTTGNNTLGWAEPAAGKRFISKVGTGAPAYTYAGDLVVWPVTYSGADSVSFNSDSGWLCKYLRHGPPTQPPKAKWRVGSVQVYMVVNTTAVNGNLCVPIQDGFDPTP